MDNTSSISQYFYCILYFRKYNLLLYLVHYLLKSITRITIIYYLQYTNLFYFMNNAYLLFMFQYYIVFKLMENTKELNLVRGCSNDKMIFRYKLQTILVLHGYGTKYYSFAHSMTEYFI